MGGRRGLQSDKVGGPHDKYVYKWTTTKGDGHGRGCWRDTQADLAKINGLGRP